MKERRELRERCGPQWDMAYEGVIATQHDLLNSSNSLDTLARATGAIPQLSPVCKNADHAA